MLPVALLAGGLATRLRPITEAIPKSLVEVAGRPFVAWQLEYLARQGITDVVMCVGHLGEQIERVVGTGQAHGLRVRYIYDGPVLAGTGGALARALPLLGQAFFVMYGDSYLPIDFKVVERAFFAQGKSALMTVLRNENQWDRSNVLYRDGRIVRYDKRAPIPEMAHIDYGLGVLAASALERRSTAPAWDLADLYSELAAVGDLAALEVTERFYEIGSHRGLDETNHYLRQERQ